MDSTKQHMVPAPFEPVVLDGRALRCWGRVYGFGQGLFPERISSDGVELLAAPMALAVKVDPYPQPTWSGIDQTWSPAQFAVQSSAPDAVEFTTRAQSQTLRAECHFRFEFDGMLLCDLTLRPKGKSVVARRIDLVLPLAPEQATLFHHNPIKPIAQWDLAHDPFNSGGVAPGGLFLPFVHTLWLGNEKRGLQWFAESDEGLSPFSYFASLHPDGRLTLNLTGTRLFTPDDPFRFTFGLIASPVKPMPPTDAIRWSWQIIGDESLKADSPDPLPRLKQSYAAGVNSSFALNITELVQRGRRDREFGQAWQRLNRAAEEAGINLQACISWITLDKGHRGTPEGATHEWLMQPELGMDLPEGLLYYPCVKGPFREWFLRMAEEGVREHGLRGAYLDGAGIAVLCSNRAHGCGYEDARGVHQTLPLLAARDLMKRLYMIFRSGDRPGQIIAHMSGFMQLPSLSFADATLGTEHTADWIPDEHPRYTLAGFRAEVGGHQYGIPSLWLYKNAQRPTLYAAFSLLHDLIPTTFDGTTMAFAEAYRDFGASEAQWVGYWEARRPVDTSDARLKVSSYLKSGTGTLTTVANLTLEPVTAALVYHEELLGVEAPQVSQVVASREATVEGNSLTLAPGGWAVVRISAAP